MIELAISGPVMRRVVPLMYSGSTPLTRMSRKFDRFVVTGLVGE